MPKKSAARLNGEALAEAGRRRSQHAVIRRYLESLDHGFTRARYVDPQQLQDRIDALTERLATVPPVQRVKLIQERINLEHELATLDDAVQYDNLDLLEGEFVENAAEWAERKGISYAALREVGVPARVLRDAGIARVRVHVS